MDILVILGVFVAVVLMIVGLYMLMKSKSKSAARAPIMDESEQSALNVESNAETLVESAPIEPVISANDFITQTIQQHAQNVSTHDLPSDHHPADPIDQQDTPSVYKDTASPLWTEEEKIVLTPELLPMDVQDHNGLDAMLDDLAQATTFTDMAQQSAIISDLNQVYDVLNPNPDQKIDLSQHLNSMSTTQLSEWDGESALIDNHLAEHTRSDEDNILVQAEQIIVIELMPKSGRPLEGRLILKLLRKHGLRFGEMDLFHRFEETTGEGAVMFSVLKHTEEGPAGFDLDTIEQEQFEGLSFFLALPGIKPLQGFDMMMSTAQRIAQECYATLLDDEMNPLSEQLKSHYRHRVLDFIASH